MVGYNLLDYNITNIKLDYNMSNAQVTAGTNEKASVSRQISPSKMEVNVKDAFVHIDTTAAQSSIGIDTPEAFSQKKADEAYQKVLAGIRERVSIGNQIGKLHEGATIAQVFKSKFERDEFSCETYVEFLPSAPAEITIEPVEIDVNYTPSEMDANWKAHQFSLGFTPANFDQIVAQQPNVDITYVGGFNYV